MRYFKILLVVIVFTFAACDEPNDYTKQVGPFAAFYPEVVAVVTEPAEDVLTITLESTGKLPADEIVYVKVPADPSIITEPAYDPFTKEVPVLISRATRIGSFTFQYKDNDYENPFEFYQLEVIKGSGIIKGGANGIFTVQVIDDDFTIFAPFSENFNANCGNLESSLPQGWEAISLASAANWGCSGNRRGASGDDNDYGLEMDNFQSDEAADDWLITPKIDISEGQRILSFSSMMRYDGSNVEVLYSTDYVKGNSPETAEWLPLQAATDAFDSNVNSFDYVNSGNISIADLPNEFNIAFHYTSAGTQSGQTGTARIDNFEIK